MLYVYIVYIYRNELYCKWVTYCNSLHVYTGRHETLRKRKLISRVLSHLSEKNIRARVGIISQKINIYPVYFYIFLIAHCDHRCSSDIAEIHTWINSRWATCISQKWACLVSRSGGRYRKKSRIVNWRVFVNWIFSRFIIKRRARALAHMQFYFTRFIWFSFFFTL